MNGAFSSLRKSLLYSWGRAQGSLSMAILWLCVGVHILILLLDRAGIIPARQVFAYLGFSFDGAIRHLWVHQFVTAALLHGGLAHLVFNMLTLWMLGPAVERVLGRGRYLLLSLLTAVSGFAGFLLFNWGSPNISVGYSGVIFGIMVAQAIYFPNNTIIIFGVFPLKMKHAVVLLSAIELYLTISPEQGGVANSAHLFGALAAFLYLKILRLHWRPWRISNQAPAHTDAGAPPEHTTPDWGQDGIAINEALQEAAHGQYDFARQQLETVRVPWSLRPVLRDLRRLVTLAERLDRNANDPARNEVEGKLERVWRRIEHKRLYATLRPLANIGHSDRVVSLVVDTLCSPRHSAMPTAIRQSLEQALAETGNEGLQMVLSKLADAATPPDEARRLSILLPAMKLQNHASFLMKAFAQAEPDVQVRWVNCLAGLKDNAAGALCDLLAGVLNRMPPDLRLAHAIQANLGSHSLEQLASRWAAGGHRSAQTVLIRLYGYQAAAFSQ